MLFSSERQSATAPTGPARGTPERPHGMERHGSTGSMLPSWAPQRHQPAQRAPTEENSDSDEENSEVGDDNFVGFSPISRTLLTTICVFGADGNLAAKKILPTLFQLWKRKLVPRDILIFGYARAEMSADQFRKQVFRCIYNPTQPQDERKAFLQRCFYSHGQFDDSAAISRLMEEMQEAEAKRLVERKGSPEPKRRADEPPGTAEREQVRLYYMAVPPFLYAKLCGCLRAHTGDGGMSSQPLAASGVRTVERFVLEKPFGRDTESCAQLNRELSMLTEEETYRIDHYLGKELVMNLLVLRFANVAFSSIWNRQQIKSVQVIFKEDFGTEGRGGYFDQYGIIRDVMQNHLLQVMALVAMEQPLAFTAEHIMAEKLKVLQACEPLTLQNLVVGQYVRSGKHPGYLEDPTIENKDSNTETFATAVLHVNNPRWEGVPFVLKAGKALTDRKAEVRIQFHRVPGAVSALKECAANELVVRLQPEQTIYWKVINKVPGLKFQVQQMRMDLLYASKFSDGGKPMPEAYERLLLEVLAADHSNFVSAHELQASWHIFTPILKELAEKQIKPEPYAYGSRGPPLADELAHRFGMTKFGGGITHYVQGGALRQVDSRAGTSTNDLLASSARATSSSTAAKADLTAAANASLLASARSGAADATASATTKAPATPDAKSGDSRRASVDLTDPRPADASRAAMPPPPPKAPAGVSGGVAGASPAKSQSGDSPHPQAAGRAPSFKPVPAPFTTLSDAGVPRLHTRSPTSDISDEHSHGAAAIGALSLNETASEIKSPPPASEPPSRPPIPRFSSGR